MGKYLDISSTNHVLRFKLLAVCVCLIFVGKGQDIHFSQYFANPISYNPANTGFFEGSYRLGANHKQQWPWAIDGKLLNYNSTSAYADFSVLDKKINDTDWGGIGLNFINDQSGDGKLTANKAYFSMAYHKGLDRYHKNFISLGATIGFVQRSIDFEQLYFNNQWEDRVGFNLSIPNQENLSTEKTTYLDIGVGLQGRHKTSEKLTIGYGFSILHLNQPKETFYNQDNRLGIRYLIHGIAEWNISKRIDLSSSTYYTYQKKASELLFGAMLGFDTHDNHRKKTSKFYLGGFYRLQDAISPIVGYQYHNTRLLLNYDVNLSELTKASNGNGGFELSLVHVGNFPKKKDFTRKIHCPKF